MKKRQKQKFIREISKHRMENAFDKPEMPAAAGIVLVIVGWFLLILYNKATTLYEIGTLASNVLFFALLGAIYLIVFCALALLVAIIRMTFFKRK